MKLNQILFALVDKDGKIVDTWEDSILYEHRDTVLREWQNLQRRHPGHYLPGDYFIIEVVLRKSGTLKAKERREAQKKGTACPVQ